MSSDIFGNWMAVPPDGIPYASVDLAKGENGRLVADVAAATTGDLALLALTTAQRCLCTYNLDKDRLVVAFPIDSPARQMWQGKELRTGELIVLGPGGRIYHIMQEEGAWGWLAMPSSLLRYWCVILSGDHSFNPVPGGVVRPPLAVFDRFVRTYREALFVFNGAPEVVAHSEALKAIEHDLVRTLVSCFTASGNIADSDSTVRLRRRHSSLMLRFDDHLDRFPHKSTTISQMGDELDVSERTLRAVCKRFTGECPRRYSAIRRMNAARTTFLQASPGAASVSSVAAAFGFRSAGRFAARYRQLFGEYPVVTLRQSMAESE